MQNVSFSKSALQVKTQIINSFSQVTPEANKAIDSLLDINKDQQVTTLEALIILNRLKDLPNNNTKFMLFFNTKVLGLDEINYVKEQLRPENIQTTINNLKKSAPTPANISTASKTNMLPVLYNMYNPKKNENRELHEIKNTPITLKMGKNYSNAPRYKDLELLCLLIIRKEPSFTTYEENLIRDPKNATNTIIHFLNDFQLSRGYNQGYFIPLTPPIPTKIQGLSDATCNQICVHNDTITGLEALLLKEHIEQTKKLK